MVSEVRKYKYILHLFSYDHNAAPSYCYKKFCYSIFHLIQLFLVEFLAIMGMYIVK